MTDGNTAIQVSPTEDTEMASVRQVFDKALNAIVDMTRLAKQVDSLSRDVSTLSDQVAHLRRQNEWLDEMLAKVRTERDELNHKLVEASHEVSAAKNENESLIHRVASLQSKLDTMTEARHSAEQARDEAQLKIMELEDTVQAHSAKLDKFHAIAKELFPVVETTTQPQTEPTPLPQVISPVPVENVSSFPSTTEAVQEVQPLPENIPEPVTSGRTYHGKEWQAGYQWDTNKQEYFTEH